MPATRGSSPTLGAPLLDLLDPRPGERILDLGCGDGALTERSPRAAPRVVGVDASAEQIGGGAGRGLDAHVMDGEALGLRPRIRRRAVERGAALDDAARRGAGAASRAPSSPAGGSSPRWAGTATSRRCAPRSRARWRRGGSTPPPAIPGTSPRPEAYRAKLDAAGFAVRQIALIPRPTPIPGDIAGWLETFGEVLPGGRARGRARRLCRRAARGAGAAPSRTVGRMGR